MRLVQATRGTALSVRHRGVGLIACGIAILGIGLDQLVKWASVAYLTPGQPIEVLGPLLKLNLIRNPGAAFGMGANATVVFSSFAIIALLACLGYALPRITRLWHSIALGLLMAGITGNLIDRIFQPPAPLHGHVVDMFQLPNFAIFNVADMCITFAAVIIVIMSFVGDRRPEGQS